MDNGLKTAGIIIIGNEILSGKVRDVNSFYLATELRSLGIDLRKISIIPDEINVIGMETREFSASYDYVFTTGGVGPTHDDVTMEGIARGFNVGLVISPEIRDLLVNRYRNSLNEAVLKMAEIPKGSNVISFDKDTFPLIRFRNIFIFPGIPGHLKKKFSMIKEHLRTRPFYLKKVFLRTSESDIADILNRIVLTNSDVILGSYPIIGNDRFTVIVTVESRSAESLSFAFNELINSIPEHMIVGIE